MKRAMKKVIYILGFSIMLTGCSNSEVLKNKGKSSDEIIQVNYENDNLYVNDEVKKIVSEINELKNKYGYEIEKKEKESIYIDIYNKYSLNEIREGYDINVKNNYLDEYYDEVIDILDNSIAKGIKEYMKEIEKEDIENIVSFNKKIGRAIVNVKKYDGDDEKYISIKLDLIDLKNDKYSETLNKIANNNYVLNNFVSGEYTDMIKLINIDGLYSYNYGNRNELENIINYNIFFKNNDINKVNILVRSNKKDELKKEDLEVFENLLRVLNIDGNDKKELEKSFKSVFTSKNVSNKMSLDGYNVIIKDDKGLSVNNKNVKLTYFSIEKSKN